MRQVHPNHLVLRMLKCQSFRNQITDSATSLATRPGLPEDRELRMDECRMEGRVMEGCAAAAAELIQAAVVSAQCRHNLSRQERQCQRL
mmetsp:Transcript_20000/g.46044  ORF Transcript_20000/g.46044 Transcript_20000/m.46044 type:complete len:89 (-) Transcript_20000:156-422(-)